MSQLGTKVFLPLCLEHASSCFLFAELSWKYCWEVVGLSVKLDEAQMSESWFALRCVLVVCDLVQPHLPLHS